VFFGKDGGTNARGTVYQYRMRRVEGQWTSDLVSWGGQMPTAPASVAPAVAVHDDGTGRRIDVFVRGRDAYGNPSGLFWNYHLTGGADPSWGFRPLGRALDSDPVAIHWWRPGGMRFDLLARAPDTQQAQPAQRGLLIQKWAMTDNLSK
jgi:hypothetical protein